MNFKERKVIKGGIIGAIIVCFLGIILPFILHPEYTLLEKFGLAQLSFSVIAFFAVFIALIIAIVQFSKSMAKPELKIRFTETNDSKCSMNILPKKAADRHLSLHVINKGNAITDLFQIDFEIPVIFNPTIHSSKANQVQHHAKGDNRIVSFLSKHEYVCFVNRPTPIPSIVLETHESEYDKYPSHIVIPYKIYGDWTEPQEGELKVNINKQEKT